MRPVDSRPIRFATIALGLCAGSVFFARGQMAHAADVSLDLVMLIDVSRSMFTDSAGVYDPNMDITKAKGSDPWRIRWDAVRLALDLLAPDDKVFISRFSSESPPPLSYEALDEKENVKLDPQGKPIRIDFNVFPTGDTSPKSRFNRQEHEFPIALLQMHDANRRELTRLADLHNTTKDVIVFPAIGTLHNGLDFGGTNILSALQQARRVLTTSGKGTAVGRRPHILLLTDGLDKRMLNNNQLSKEALDVLKYLSEDGRGRTSIPIHTLGLNICGIENKEERLQARTLLRELSAKTQGQHREIAGTKDLVPFFRSLVRDVKGYWSEQRTYPPALANAADLELPTRASAELQGLAVMVYGDALNEATNPKDSLRPPEDFQSAWIDPAAWKDKKPAEPLSQGKQGFYRMLAFGPTDANPSSPFSGLENGKTATLSLSWKSRSFPQTAVVLKRPLIEPFTFEEPQTDTPWKRHAADFRIRVRMRHARFRPEDFRVTAEFRTLTRVNASTIEPQSDVDPLCAGAVNLATTPDKQIPLTQIHKEGDSWIFSSGNECLDRLLPKRTTGADDCELTIVIEVPDKVHPLGGSQRRMPPRTIRVQHEPIRLERPATPPPLANDTPAVAVKIRPIGCLGQPVPMQMKFTPPQAENAKPLDVSLFKIDADFIDPKTLLVNLNPDGTTVTVSLPPKDQPRPEPGINYLPGLLEFALIEDDKRQASLRVPVELQLDLIRMAFSGRPNELVASDEPQSSNKLSLTTVKDADKQHVGDVEVVLKPAASLDDEKQMPSQFPEQQLWLQPGDESKAAGDTDRKQRLTVKPGQPFKVWFRPVGNANRGRFHYELRIASKGVTGSSVPGIVEVGNFKLRPSDQVPALFAEPGQSARGQFKVRLGGRPGDVNEFEIVSLRGPDLDRPEICTVTVSNDETKKIPLELQAEPVSLPTMSTDDTAIDFQLRLPPAMAVGSYTGKLVVGGDAVTPAVLPFTLLVDRLKLQRPDQSSSKPVWIDLNSDWESFTQISTSQGERHLRVVRATGLPVQKEDIEGKFLEPLKDEVGVVTQKQLPEVKEIRNDPDGNGVILRIEFPRVPNFDSGPHPYHATLWVYPARNSTGKLEAFREVQGEFAVRYIVLRRLIGPKPK